MCAVVTWVREGAQVWLVCVGAPKMLYGSGKASGAAASVGEGTDQEST